VIKSRKMMWVERVAPMGEKKFLQNFGWNAGRKHDLEDVRLDGRILLKRIVRQ
jgi:hypothetical protein